MRRSVWLGLAFAGTAMAAVTIHRTGDVAGTSTVSVVDGIASDTGSAATGSIQSLAGGQPLISPTACNTIICTATPTPAPDPRRCNLASNPTLRDLAYFANSWFFLQRDASSPSLPLGGGYANARVVEKLDRGSATDVVIAYTGANSTDDFASAVPFIAGIDTPQLRAATALYESVLKDPRYARARFHVTGFSLGAGLTQYMLAYTIATYGTAFADARGDFIAFGVPGWRQGAATRYGLDPAVLDGRFDGYTPQNDVVKLLGPNPTGTQHMLAPYTPVGIVPGLPANGVIAHSPYPYIAAIGLPTWLGDQAVDVEARVQQGQALPTDPDYGSPGTVAVDIIGDAAGTQLTGAGGNDVLRGGGGADVMCGGGGGDRFAYAAASDSAPGSDTSDRILDFTSQEGDRIDLSDLAASLRIEGFAFIGSSSFSGGPQVRAYTEGQDTVVAVNWTSDVTPELLVRLRGRPQLTAAQFVLAASRELLTPA